MAWTASKVFRPFVADVLTRTATALDLDADSFKVALYDNDITPDTNVTSANSAYNAGQWVSTGNEVWQVTTWPQTGVALTSRVVDSATAGAVFFDAADTASGASCTLTANYGCLVYDDTATSPADQGVCFNYFGGSQSVTNGVFTVVWHANGIFRFTL